MVAGGEAHLQEVEFQMRFREILERVAAEGRLDRSSDSGIGPYLTVSRQPFSGGAAIARGVGLRLGWSVLDKELVDTLAAHLKVSPGLLELIDETKSSWLRDDVLNLLESRMVDQDEYVSMVGRVVQVAAYEGKVVVVGRGANFLLPPEGGLRVRVVAPKEERLQRLCKEQDIGEELGRDRLASLDADRSGFLNRHFGVGAGGVYGYDLVLDTSRFGIEGSIELIASACDRLGLGVPAA